jgi:hypothetical protein
MFSVKGGQNAALWIVKKKICELIDVIPGNLERNVFAKRAVCERGGRFHAI